jgi:hemerythrin-like domain-containing protein
VLAPRVLALSEQLVRVHQELRERLASLRAEPTDGSVPQDSVRRDSVPRDLLSHCLSFCTTIHTHHTGEDQQLFPALRAAAPELTPIISKLEEDHVLVAGILRQLRDLLTTRPVAPDPATLQRELDGLTAILESHFSFEERRIAAALDGLGPENQFPAVFTPGLQFPT